MRVRFPLASPCPIVVDWLRLLAQRRINVAFGDINIPDPNFSTSINILSIERTAGLAGLGLYGFLGLADFLKIPVTKRKFIERSLLAGSLWATAPALIFAIKDQLVDNKIPEENAAKRIMNRFSGMSFQFHPEALQIFFRNLLVADKLLEVGKVVKNEKGRQPKIAYKVGGAHSGLEDFLQLGQEVCRTILLSYPTEILKTIVEANNGIKDFCSIKLLALPEDFDPNSPQEDFNDVTDRLITDHVLFAQLSKKLSK